MGRSELVRRLGRTGLKVARRLPGPVEKRYRQLANSTLFRQVIHATTGAQKKESGPLVSIVVPVYNVAEYLPEFLDSVVGQTYKNLEILVIDDGSPDESASIARRWARWDKRIRVISKPNGGLGAARNTGIDAARGDYLTFADSDDVYDSNAIHAMVSTLEKTGSDFVVGTMVRRTGKRDYLPKWNRKVHETDRLQLTIDEYPDILLDVFAWNKLWRRDFFNEHVRGFPERILYEDQEPSALSYINARSFDVIKDHVYYWRVREDGTSITQQKAKINDLSDRLKVSLAVARTVVDHPSVDVRNAWYSKIFGIDLIQYIEQVPRTDDTYFEVLSQGLQSLVDLCEPDFWKQVKLYPRLATWFAYQGRKDDLIKILSGNLVHGPGYRLLRDADRTIALPSFVEDLAVIPPNDVLVVRSEAFDQVTKLTNVRWLDDTRVALAGAAFVKSAFDSDDAVSVRVFLRNNWDGGEVEVHTDAVHDETINQWAHTEARNCAHCGFRAVVDVSQLSFPAKDDGNAEKFWQLVVKFESETLVTEDIVREIFDDAGAAALGHSGFVDGRLIALKHDSQQGVRFERAKPLALAHHIELSGRSLDIAVSSLSDADVTGLILNAKSTGQKVKVSPVKVDADGVASFEVDVPRLSKPVKPGKLTRWQLEALMSDGSRRLVNSGRGSAKQTADESVALLGMNLDPRGYVRFDEASLRFTCENAEVNGDSIDFSGHFTSTDGRRPHMDLVLGSQRLVSENLSWDEATGAYTVSFSLVESVGGDDLAVGEGVYALKARLEETRDPRGRGEFHAFIPSWSTPSLPWGGLTSKGRIEVRRTRKLRRPWIKVLPPQTFDERGLYRQRALIDAARSEDNAIKDSVFFESFHGKQISDSTLAIFEWVRTHHPDIECYWSLSSEAVPAPAGATGVVRWTREWHDALASSRYLINNANFPAVFELRPGQRYLQTWHGTPLKKIAEDMPPANLSLGYRLHMKRESEYWELLLAQNDFAAEILPAAFRYDGDVANVGYPRNDRLATQLSGSAEADLRSQYGIASDAPIVLYAPTFRDNAKEGGGRYALATDLDFEEFLSGIPHDAVIMLRGHSNTIGSSAPEFRGRVVDVSAHDDINDLILVSDLLITDYSSVMFDYAVTRKPMLFFAPDLDEYSSETRGFYFDYESTVPGQVHSESSTLARDVSRALADPGAFVDDRYASFARRFAPRDDGHATQRVGEILEARGWFSA